MKPPSRQPVPDCGPGAPRPGPELLDRDLSVIRELVLADPDLARFADLVIGEDDLIYLRERIGAKKADQLRIEPRLLFYFP